ncbi:MAG: hypothetical protein LC768_09090, partial [Acidobacteria bacterium]|nr:hypothetical protein [Acidobacteriota bacterium]
EKRVSKTKQLLCSKCNRNVAFRYYERQFFADEIEEPVSKVVDEIIDYGQCQLAAEATIPRHPIHSEIQECPVYQALNSR